MSTSLNIVGPDNVIAAAVTARAQGAVGSTAGTRVNEGASHRLRLVAWPGSSRIGRGVRIALVLICSLAISPARAAEINYHSDDGLNIIVISGRINGDDSARFERIANSITGPTLVFLNSPGGTVVEGLIIGESIRSRGFMTEVPAKTVCASTCGLMWLAGTTRYVSGTSHIGFHAAYTGRGNNAKETGVGNALIGAYLTRLGLSYGAILFMTSSAPNQMTWIHQADAQRIGIEVNMVAAPTPEASSVPHAPVLPSRPAKQRLSPWSLLSIQMANFFDALKVSSWWSWRRAWLSHWCCGLGDIRPHLTL